MSIINLARMILLRSAFALLCFAFALTGCVTSRMAAERIVTAPNQNQGPGYQRQMRGLWQLVETNLLTGHIETPLAYASVPVGPPSAELKVVVFPAQDYHLTVHASITNNAKGNPWISVIIKTNATDRLVVARVPATIVMLHGYMLSKETMLPWALQLAQAGYRVVLVDLRGHGQSTGDTIGFGKYEVNDLRQLLDQLQAQGLCDGSIGVMGLSYGATLALHWAAQDTRIRAVVALAPYNQPAEAFERLARLLKVPITHGAAQKAVTLAAQRLDLNWSDWSGEAAVRRVNVPVFFIGGARDTLSAPADVARLKAEAGGITQSLELEYANHFTVPLFFGKLSVPVEAWFESYLTAPVAAVVK